MIKILFPKPNHKRRKPKRINRGNISKQQRQLAYEWFGDTCAYCNARPIELHHVVFRSQGGRGNYRNLVPLCKPHHAMAHSSPEFAEHWREERKEAFGKHYFRDMYDLYEMRLIPEATEFEYEKFMRKEERK